mmetsp:Transcript_17131/g.39622  ORF Transcript_17131/g.39622 Transcript_17131/m.39622 type:complete len:244 (-) Transcript_17131:1302-2033(-)
MKRERVGLFLSHTTPKGNPCPQDGCLVWASFLTLFTPSGWHWRGVAIGQNWADEITTRAFALSDTLPEQGFQLCLFLKMLCRCLAPSAIGIRVHEMLVCIDKIQSLRVLLSTNNEPPRRLPAQNTRRHNTNHDNRLHSSCTHTPTYTQKTFSENALLLVPHASCVYVCSHLFLSLSFLVCPETIFKVGHSDMWWVVIIALFHILGIDVFEQILGGRTCRFLGLLDFGLDLLADLLLHLLQFLG